MTPLTPELIERVRVLRASGLSLRQVAATIGCGYGTAQKAAMPPSAPLQPSPRPAYYADSPGPGACAWPTSSGRPWRFCAADRKPGGVYCAEHTRQATGGRSWQAAAA